jgi:hypothetical protein
MDLKSGCSYWLVKNGWLTTYPTLKEDISFEVQLSAAASLEHSRPIS